MQIFAVRTRAFIDNSIKSFADPESQAIWAEWSSAHPQVRHTVNDADDDGSGPMSDAIRGLIIDALHRRYDHLMARTLSPVLRRDEIVSLSSDAGTIYAIACSISGSHRPWLSRAIS